MRTLTTNEMYEVCGGGTLTCSYCGKVFKDKSIFGFVYSKASTQLNKHYGTCKGAKAQRYGK